MKRTEQNWFGAEFKAKAEFCTLIGSYLQGYDANGDGYDDLTCHTSNGTITISESHIVEKRGISRVFRFQHKSDISVQY